MLGLRTALTWLLPELPSWLAAEIARAEHCRREMQCKGLSPHMTPSPPSTTTSMQSQDNGFDQHVLTPDAAGVGASASSELGAAAASFGTGRSQVLADNIVFHHIAPITPKFKKYDGGGGGGEAEHCDMSPCSQVRRIRNAFVSRCG